MNVGKRSSLKDKLMHKQDLLRESRRKFKVRQIAVYAGQTRNLNLISGEIKCDLHPPKPSTILRRIT